MKKILIIALAFSMGFMALAQEKFTDGIIISKQTMSSDNEQANAQFALMGDVINSTFIKGAKSRSELSSPLTGDIITISDMDKKEMLMLMDSPGMGKKYFTQKLDLTEEALNSINLIEGTETKTVLGYECKQYTVTVNQGGVEMEMVLFTTEEIPPVVSQQTAVLGDKLKGFPLYMTMTMNQQGTKMVIITEVTEIKKEEVSEDKFSMTPPEGYEKMN
jgi:hypothetical protein